MARLVKSGRRKTASTLMPYEEASKACERDRCRRTSALATARGRACVVILPDTEGCPCGGTHVEDVGDVGAFAVTGVRVKKGVTGCRTPWRAAKGHK